MNRWLGAALAAAIIAAPMCAHAQRSVPPPSTELFHLLEVFGGVQDIVERQYVKTPDDKRLMYAAMGGLLTSLDPHSGYLPPDLYRAMTGQVVDPTHAVGIGVYLMDQAGYPRIVEVIDGGPAERAGLRAGDIVTWIDGKAATYLTSVEGRLTGSVGQRMTLGITRAGASPFEVTVVLEPVVHRSMQYQVASNVAVLRIRNLQENTAALAQSALSAAQSHGPVVRGLVLDMRGCPGGLLGQSVAVPAMFLNGGVIVSQHGRSPADIERYNARPNAQFGALPIVVLVDGRTAAGCEIIAAALQDRARAKVVGMPTFGQGTVQTVIPLHNGDDGAMKLTTSFVLRPSGKPLQKFGVIPDVVVANTQQEADDLAQRKNLFSEATLPGALDYGDPIERPLPASAEAPPSGSTGDYQLERAISILNGGK